MRRLKKVCAGIMAAVMVVTMIPTASVRASEIEHASSKEVSVVENSEVTSSTDEETSKETGSTEEETPEETSSTEEETSKETGSTKEETPEETSSTEEETPEETSSTEEETSKETGITEERDKDELVESEDVEEVNLDSELNASDDEQGEPSEVLKDIEESKIVTSSETRAKSDISVVVGKSFGLSCSDIFGTVKVETVKKTTAADWKWMVTNASSGEVTDDGGLSGLNKQYIIYLGKYNLSEVEKVRFDIDPATDMGIDLDADFVVAESFKNASENSNVQNTKYADFKIYGGDAWDYDMDIKTSGSSIGSINKNGNVIDVSENTGEHDLYFRCYYPKDPSSFSISSITFVTGEKSVDGGSGLLIQKVLNPKAEEVEAGSLGMSVENDRFLWNTGSMDNSSAGSYTVTFEAEDPDKNKVTKEVSIALKAVQSSLDPSESIDIPTLDAVTTKRGQNVTLSKGDIFGEKTCAVGQRTTAEDWQWMITKSSAGEVTEDGMLKDLNARYIIYMGKYDLTDVTEFVLNMGLNSSITMRGNIFVDYGSVDVSGASSNSSVQVADSIEDFNVYQGDAWDCGADGDGESLCGNFVFTGNSENAEQEDYECKVNNGQEGIHAVYFRAYYPESSWPGNLASITLATGKETVYGGNEIKIKSVTKDEQSLTEDEYTSLGMELTEDGFTWRIFHMSNSEAGMYEIVFSATDGNNQEIENAIQVTVEAGDIEYKHPGILYTNEQIEQIYKNYNAGKEPWKSAGDELLADAHAEYTLRGYESVLNAIGGGKIIWTDTSSVVNGNGFNNLFRSDCQVAYQNTLAYLLTKDRRYAEVAINILNSYAKMKPSIQGHDRGFVASQMAFRLCNAAELLKYHYVDESGNSKWKEEDILIFQEWIMDEFVPLISDGYGMANGGISALKGMLAVGIFCENDYCYNFAIDGYLKDENVGVTGAINDFGQNRESGRDQIHSQLIIGHFSEIAWTGYNQGLNLFEHGDHRLLKGYEYMLKYMMGEEVEYDKDFYSTNYNYSNVISEGGRGLLLPCYEFIYNYYTGVLGWDKQQLPYTAQAVAFTRNEGVACYNDSYDTYHLIGYGTLNTAVSECPAEVSDVAAAAGDGGTADISWSASSGASGYNIYRSNQKVSDLNPKTYPMAWYDKVNEKPVSGTSYQDDGLVAGESYFYKITAVNSDGEESGCSEPVYVTGKQAAPTKAPEYVRTAAVSDDITKVSWSAVSGAAGYHVYVSTDDSEYEKQSEELVEGTYCYHLGLKPDTKYRYKIVAVNNYGESGLSEAYGERTTSQNASGSGGVIRNYPQTISIVSDADVSVSSGDEFTNAEKVNECANSSKVSYLKFDFTKISLNKGDIADKARLNIYRSGSTSPVSVQRVESESTDYDNWNEGTGDNDVISFEKGNLCFAIPNDALSYEIAAGKPSANQTYNSEDGSGINVLDAVNAEIAGDRVLTLRVSATGTGGSSSMSFHSRHAVEEKYRPSLVVTISNSVIEAYENGSGQTDESLNALKDLIAEYEKKEQGSYTQDSWNVFIEALEAAREVSKKENATKAEIDEASKNLKEAYGNLKEPESEKVDKTELSELIEKYKDMVQGEYTDQSWEAFRKALETAQSVLDKADAAQSEVNNAKNDLSKAHESLKTKREESLEELNRLIAEYEEKTQDNYTQDSWDAFTKALEAAQEVSKKENATKAEIDEASKNLKEAYGNLKESESDAVDKTALAELIEEYKDMVQDEYTDQSWEAFRKALETAQSVLDKADAVQSEVNNAKNDLSKAHESLKTKREESLEELNRLIAEYEGKNQGSYTQDSWDAFTKALEAAREVSKKENATKAEIDEASKNLKEAYGNLKEPESEKVDKTKLSELITVCKTVQRGNYTLASWTVFMDALTVAETVAAKTDATQAEVDDAEAVLRSSYDALERQGLWVEWIESENFIVNADGDARSTYTGNAIKPLVAVYDGENLLREKADYTLAYKNNINAGKAIVVINGKGNYEKGIEKKFTIDKVNLADLEIADLYAAVAENNTRQTALKPVVVYNGKKLVQNKDYTAVYENPETDGIIPREEAYTVKIKSVANSVNFTGETTIHMWLTDRDKQILMSKVSIGRISAQSYQKDADTGKGIVQKPAVTVKYKGKFLRPKGNSQSQEEWDYEILYDEKHTEAGETAVLTIKGNGKTYVGIKTASFKIKGMPLAAKAVKLKDVPKTGLVYTGAELRPEVEVNGLNSDSYEVSYQNNLNAGTATVVVTGKNGYTGRVKKTFKITAYDLKADSDTRFTLNQIMPVPYAKGGSRIHELPAYITVNNKAVQLEEGKDYTLSYKNNKTVGMASVTIKGKRNYKGTIQDVSFEIVQQNLENLCENAVAADILEKNAAKYNRVIPVITDLNGKVLKNKTDYIIDINTAYTDESGNIISAVPKKGDAIRVTVKAKENSNYTGEVHADFRVIADDRSVTKAVITAAKQQYTGKEIRLGEDDLNVTVRVDGKKQTLKLGEDYEIIGYQKNVDRGTAKFTIRGIGKYGGTKTGSFKIVRQQMKLPELAVNALLYIEGLAY